MSMEITIATQIEKVIINVTPAREKIGEIVGFVEVNFVDNENNLIFIVRGYTIRVKIFKNTPTFVVSAPAYRSGLKYRVSFVIDNKSLWHNLVKTILEDFSNQTGGLKPEDYIAKDISPDEIPI